MMLIYSEDMISQFVDICEACVVLIIGVSEDIRYACPVYVVWCGLQRSWWGKNLLGSKSFVSRYLYMALRC